MVGSLLLAAAFQVGPFYEQKPGYVAVRPAVAVEDGVTDVLWPVFTSHRDWWRFCYIVNYQDTAAERGSTAAAAGSTGAGAGGAGDYQFSVVPLWFNGRSGGDFYWGLFPLWGHHPHLAMMWDVDFALWPLYTHYRMPRRREWMDSYSILFPFFSWRTDGSWSVWPLYGVNHQRESDHRYVLWPVATWASYREDRDTAGEGWSWMLWPLYGQVRRERESQDMFIPPFFSYARTFGRSRSTRIRCPWPFFEYEATPMRRRLSLWPLYERSVNIDFAHGREESTVTRFGWKLVEIYDDEVRVFPFIATGRNHHRVWPFWEAEETKQGFTESRVLALFPIRWVPAVDRNWSKFWTFYEARSCPLYTDHSLLWGIIRWRTWK